MVGLPWSDGLCGQEIGVRTLTAFMTAGGAGRFFLIHGPQGVGKGTAARLAAAALLCRDGPERRCGTCLACRDVGAHPDAAVLVPDQEGGTIKIDDVRSVSERAFVAPLQAARRVWIIDPMEALTAAAANALLRILEEPPSALWTIGVAHNVSGVPVTLRSRALRVPFTTLSAQIIGELIGVADDDSARAGTVLRARLLADEHFRKNADVWRELLSAPQFDPEGAVRFARGLRDEPGGLAGFWTGVLTVRAGVAGRGAVRYNGRETSEPDLVLAEAEERRALLAGIDDLDANVNPALVCDDVLRCIRRIRKQTQAR